MIRYFSPTNYLHTQNTKLKYYNSKLITKFPILIYLYFKKKPKKIIIQPLINNLPHPILH